MEHWLLDQVPVVVVMGIMIYIIYKYLLMRDKVIQGKDEAIEKISQKALTVAAMWEAKGEMTTVEHQTLMKQIEDNHNELKTLIKELNDNFKYHQNEHLRKST